MSGEVLISAENSTDLTMTVAAEAELTQFVDRNSADLAATTARSTTNDLKKKYRVYRVDLEKNRAGTGGFRRLRKRYRNTHPAGKCDEDQICRK